MSDGGEFQVELGQLRDHAATVGDLAEATRSAAQTAQSGLSGDAFGIIGQFLASAIAQAGSSTQAGVTRAAETVADVNSGLVNTAQAYQQIDTSHSGSLSRILRENR